MAASASSDDDEFSESELEDYESKAYELLKTGGNDKIIKPDGSLRCPFCNNKKKQRYIYEDLLQHASGIGASDARSFSQKANHLALARFLRSDIPAAYPPPPPSVNSSTSSQPRPQEEDQPRPQEEDHFVWTNGRLKTVTDLIEEEEERKRKVALLAGQIEINNERVVDMESRYNETAFSIQQIMKDRNL